MKPMQCVLREKGHIIIIFIDDLLIIATSYEKCAISILETIQLLTEFGFNINGGKSVFIPLQHAIFLGFVLNSVDMTITLTEDKIHKIIICISNLLSKKSPLIRKIAQVIGCMVSRFPAVKYGKCHYRALENDKIEALKASKGCFNTTMCLSTLAVADLKWWLDKLPASCGFVQLPPIACTLSSDASLRGWGGAMGDISTGGPRQPDEAQEHINSLEIYAAYFTLKSFLPNIGGKHVKILIDNTCAVSVLNNMGTCHNEKCNDIATKIWGLCEENNMWLTAAHIPGAQNITADYESRNFNMDIEWMLNPKILTQALQGISFSPTIDMFASRLNKQFPQYVSYRSDPFALHIDAFTISWADKQFYCFPPFSCVLKVIRKVINDKGRGILVIPYWPTQLWFPLLTTILEQHPTILQPSKNLLLMPSNQEQIHPLRKTLRLAICLVSGQNYK